MTTGWCKYKREDMGTYIYMLRVWNLGTLKKLLELKDERLQFCKQLYQGQNIWKEKCIISLQGSIILSLQYALRWIPFLKSVPAFLSCSAAVTKQGYGLVQTFFWGEIIHSNCQQAHKDLLNVIDHQQNTNEKSH